MMSELVQEDMQKHEGASLRLGESAHDTLFQSVGRNTEPLEYRLMGIEIRHGNLHPEVVRPRVKKNNATLLAMIKAIRAIAVVRAPRQHDTLQPLRKAEPLWNDVNESLNVTLGDDVTKPAPR
jgi:hypothetical protein